MSCKGVCHRYKNPIPVELKDTKKVVSDAIPVGFSLNGMDCFVHAAKCN